MQEPVAIEVRLNSAAECDRVTALAELVLPDSNAAAHQAAVTDCLRFASDPVRHLAAVVLGRIGAPAIEGLLEALNKTQSIPVRMAAAAGIASIGPPAAPAVLELCRCLASGDENLRAVAVVALGRMGAPAVGGLRRMLQFADPLVVAAAVDALAIVGLDAAEALPDVHAIAVRSPLPLQLACAAALVKLSGDPQRGLPVLEQAMRMADPATRKQAVEKIGEMQQLAHPAAPLAIALTRDPEPSVRAAACLALARLRSPDQQAITALGQAMNDLDAKVRLNAIIGMSAYGKAVCHWDAHIEARTADPDEGVASAAKQVLGNLRAG